MYKILLSGWLLSLVFCLSVMAQDATITGRVTSSDESGGLPGVSVTIKGTQRGATTTPDGRYSIQASPNATLVFSFIGYSTQEVAIGNRTTVDVVLASDTRQLNEVVVIGYGSVQRSRLTSAISTINGQAVANLVTPSFDQQLAGRAAGVQVTVPTGIIGQPPRIRIRGTNSISSGASPLVVIDGVPVLTGNQSGVTQTNPLGDINPQDIESYDILKDGAATARGRQTA
jgi:TonB-dependent starch-binding outer membrane protein SusC